MNPLKVSQTQGFHRSDSNVGSPQRLQKQNTRPQVVKKAAKKPEPKREFSENVKKLIAKVRFRVKLYLAFNKARQAIDDYNDSLNPNYKYLVKVLRNPYRSNENAQRILEYIKPLPFFAKFINDLGDIGSEAVIQLCKHIRHEYIPAATCIFKEGDVSNDKFYVIIKGSISIVKKVDRNVFQAENERLQKGDKVDEPENKETAPQQSIQNIEDKVYSLEKELENLIASLGVKLKEMKEGEGFGEKALIEKSKRSTSVVTNSNCEFIVIMKNDYMNIIRKYDKRHQIKSEFMKTKIPFLNTINSPIIWEDIYYLIKDVDRPKGSILANENEKGNKIFFIVSGYCEIEKSIVVERNGTHIQYDPVKYKRAIAKFDAGNCLGEEILINKSGAYDYTIRVESTTANIYYVEKEGFLKRFPPDSIKTIIKNFLLKETVHLQKIAKLQEEAKDALYGKETGQLNLKTNQILRCLNTPSRAKVSRLIQLSQTKELESQDRVLLIPPPIEIAEDGSPPQITGENDGFYDMKNKLDSFLRNAVQAKPSTPQLPKLFTVQSPKTFKERGPKSLQSSPMSLNPSKFASEKKLDKIKMGKEEIIPISSNPEQNIKLKLVYKRVETATEQADQTPGGENNKSQPGNQKVDFNENKFDFGTKYVRRYPVDKRKISTSQQGSRPTPTDKIMWMLQRNLQNKLPEGQPEERGPEKINFHLDGGFPARRNSKVSYRKTGLSVSKRESPLLTNDNSRLDRSINNKPGEDSVLIRRLQHFQIQSSMRKKRSMGSFQKEQTSVDEILQHSKSQINFDQTPSRESSNRFMVTAFTPSNKVISQERSKTAKVLEAFSP